MKLIGYFQAAARVQRVTIPVLKEREPLKSLYDQIVSLTLKNLNTFDTEDRRKIEQEIKEYEDSLIFALKMLT